MSEKMGPDDIATLLNEYFTEMVEIVFENNGTLDKFMGDAIMALWGAPIAHEDHAQRACYAALHLRDRLGSYADELRIDPGVNFDFEFATYIEHLLGLDVVAGHDADRTRQTFEPGREPVLFPVPGIG